MIFQWDRLRALGESKLVRSNYIWIFIIPLLHRNLLQLSEKLDITISFHVKLEFLFLASIFFALGTLTYQLRCPTLIARFKTNQELLDSGMNSQHVVDFYEGEINKFFPGTTYSDLEKELSKVTVQKYEGQRTLVSFGNINRSTKSHFIDSDKTTCFFWNVYKNLNNNLTYSRLIITFSYALGVFFLFVTTINNIISTIIDLYF
jgi:hypothetical protein